VECTAVDSQYLAEKVYQFCSVRRHRKIYAVRGINLVWRPIIERPSRNNPYRTPVYGVCTDTAKLQIFARLQIPMPPDGQRAPGCMHFPDASWVDAEYFAQLTAEKGIWKYVKGKGSVRVWRKIRERNEALDLEVYSLAALHVLGPMVIGSLRDRVEELRRPLNAASVEPREADARKPRRRVGWVDKWRS